MAQHVQQVRKVYGDGGVTRTTKVYEDDDQTTVSSPQVLAARVVWYIAGVILTLLAIRFVLILLGANHGNAFVNFIYSLTYPLARPFFGIFGYTIKYGVSRVELSTLVAMAVYALIAYGIAKLILIDRRSE